MSVRYKKRIMKAYKTFPKKNIIFGGIPKWYVEYKVQYLKTSF